MKLLEPIKNWWIKLKKHSKNLFRIAKSFNLKEDKELKKFGKL